MIITEEKKILKDFVTTVPEALMGPDRVTHILENCSKLQEEEKILLRKFVNKVLTSMIERDASDIEIGGHGNEGYVWMRIHGRKERVKDLPQFNEDESALIISNLFNSNQKKYLATTRNLDFSY